MPEGGSPEAVPPPPPARASIRLEGVGGARLLASDLRTASIRLRAAFLLVNEARHTMLERLFGLSGSRRNLPAAVVALMLAESAYDRIEKILTPPAPPSAGEMALAAAVWKEVVQVVAGPGSRDTPLVLNAGHACGARQRSASCAGTLEARHRWRVGPVLRRLPSPSPVSGPPPAGVTDARQRG